MPTREAGRVRRLGLTGACADLALAVLIASLASGNGTFPNPPEEVPRGLALGLLYTLPAAVGAIGAITGKRSLLAAAATMAALGSVVAFSGVTLVFLVPAVFFAAAATEATPPTSGNVVHLVVLAALTVLVATIAALAIGIFAIPLFVVLLAAIGAARRSRHKPLRATASSAIVAIVIVSLWIGSGLALLSMTESRCWVAYSTESGITYRSVPTTSTIELGPADLAGGCDSGTLTRRGAGLAAGLALLAVGVAVIAGQTRAHPGSREAVA